MVANKPENSGFEVDLYRVAMTSHSDVHVQVNVYLNLPIKPRNSVTKVDGISLGSLVMGLFFRFNVFKPLQSNHIKA